MDEIQAEVEEECGTKIAGMHQQGAWTSWEHVEQRKITWSELWRAETLRIKFLIRSVYDILPSPANLHCWGLADTPACQLCQKRGTLEHILSSCPKALGGWVVPLAKNSKYQHTSKQTISFGIRGTAGHLDTSRGPITPGLVAQVRMYGDQRPETPQDPRLMTEEVSK